MEGISKIIDVIYDKFFLRDLLAKITPGAFFICAMLIPKYSINELNSTLKDSGFGIWILLISVSWLVGISLQGIGEIFSIISYYPINKDNISKKVGYLENTIVIQNDEYNKFIDKASDLQIRRRERHTVIKEASGNMVTSLIFSAILDILYYKCSLSTIYSGYGLIVVGLFFMHKAHVVRQKKITDSIINNRGSAE